MAEDEELFHQSAEQLFNHAPCGYLLLRPDGTILRVNDTFLTLTGYTREALVSLTRFKEILTVPARIYYDTNLAPLLRMSGEVNGVVLDIVLASRGTLPALVNLAEKRNEQGQAELLTVMLFDATNRRHYENDLLLARRTAEEATQTERLAREVAERANRAKDEFLALISHELRTPLGAILGWSQVLRRPGSSAKDLEHGLSVIERNARLQARLVDDLLDMSRIVSGKLRLDVQRVDLAEVIEAAVQTAQPAAQAREIRIQKILDHQIVVAGDPGRLQQVFWNLFSNAVKFTPTGGSVRVVTERVESHVEVSVIDTGQGMSAEFLAHAFERFRQSDSAPTQKTGGLGLGLSIVRHLVEMHGGTVEARSDGEGKGATFVVKLPLIAVHPSSERKVHPRSAIAGSGAVVAPVDLRGARVLIVDDEPDARELLAQVLAEAGAEVVSAGTAQAGLDALAQSRPDVLVSDIGLPDADGYDFIRRARMRGESATTPALALTAFSSMEDRTRAMLAGYQMHLAKPVDAHEFLVTVASLCGRLLPRVSGRG